MNDQTRNWKKVSEEVTQLLRIRGAYEDRDKLGRFRSQLITQEKRKTVLGCLDEMISFVFESREDEAGLETMIRDMEWLEDVMRYVDSLKLEDDCMNSQRTDGPRQGPMLGSVPIDDLAELDHRDLALVLHIRGNLGIPNAGRHPQSRIRSMKEGHCVKLVQLLRTLSTQFRDDGIPQETHITNILEMGMNMKAMEELNGLNTWVKAFAASAFIDDSLKNQGKANIPESDINTMLECGLDNPKTTKLQRTKQIKEADSRLIKMCGGHFGLIAFIPWEDTTGLYDYADLLNELGQNKATNIGKHLQRNWIPSMCFLGQQIINVVTKKKRVTESIQNLVELCRRGACDCATLVSHLKGWESKKCNCVPGDMAANIRQWTNSLTIREARRDGDRD